jgi:hypothetical protein
VEKAMHTIEIDFDVFKRLTVMRETETVTYNDVLRQALGMASASPIPAHAKAEPQSLDWRASSGSWTTKGVTFPADTEFRASYRGETIHGRVEAGALAVNGKRYESPSAAAVAITGNSVNGWVFWECKKPGSGSWQMIKSLRKGS